jgi:hypothetical protein
MTTVYRHLPLLSNRARLEHGQVCFAAALGHKVEGQEERAVDQEPERNARESGTMLLTHGDESRDEDDRQLDVLDEDEVPLHACHARPFLRREPRRRGLEQGHETLHLRVRAEIETGAERDLRERQDSKRHRERAKAPPRLEEQYRGRDSDR